MMKLTIQTRLPRIQQDQIRESFGSCGEVGGPAMITMSVPPTATRSIQRKLTTSLVFVVLNHKSSDSERLGELINLVRENASQSAPVCVGFGISTPEQAAQVGALADGVIVGSACVKRWVGVKVQLKRPRNLQEVLEKH